MNTTKTNTNGSIAVRRAREARHIRKRRAMFADVYGLTGRMKSESRDGIVHVAHILDNGSVVCTCEDARYRRTRQHIGDTDSLCKHGRLLRAALLDAHRLRTQEVA